MKLAICIPSYNESENIEKITKIVDEGLSRLNDVDSVIVNCDNNSPDKTNIIFNKTETIHKKDSIVTNEKGKGINLLNFFKYCINNNIDYAITLDADLKSITPSWIEKFYLSLLKQNDFVFPNYKRNYQEGNTTNHFISPILYKKYGKFIRQPIGGDYAFNRKYIEIILKNEFSKNILMYGIDIFMVVTAIVNDLKLDFVELGYKVHNSSFAKMETIFESVLRGFSEVCKQYQVNLTKDIINYECYKYDNVKMEDIPFIMTKYNDYYKKYNFNNYDEILQKWNSLLDEYLDNIYNISEELISIMKEVFICRAVSFWIKYENDNNWESSLIKELYGR